MQLHGYTHTHRTRVTPGNKIFSHLNTETSNTKMWKVTLRAKPGNLSIVGCKNEHKSLHLLPPWRPSGLTGWKCPHNNWKLLRYMSVLIILLCTALRANTEWDLFQYWSSKMDRYQLQTFEFCILQGPHFYVALLTYLLFILLVSLLNLVCSVANQASSIYCTATRWSNVGVFNTGRQSRQTVPTLSLIWSQFKKPL